MRVWTYAEARDKVLVDLDLQDEDFIAVDEMVGYFNEAIDEAEAEIHKLNEDYFLRSTPVTLVQGTSTYALPADIYANKVRQFLYSNGSVIYAIRRVRGENKFLDIAVQNYNPGSEWYNYFIQNVSAAAGYQIVLVPPARESGAFGVLWYLRNATRVPLIATGSLAATEASPIDIPEFINFVIQYVKVRCLEKEGDPRTQGAVAILQQQRQMMVDTLTQMVPDDDDELIADFTFYNDHQ